MVSVDKHLTYSPPSPSKDKIDAIVGASRLRLVICVAGIYGCFLSWGVLQERISTISYSAIIDGTPMVSKFRSFLVLNTVQATIAATMAFVALRLQHKSIESLHLGTFLRNHSLCWAYLRLAVCSCTASPFGYAALQHITYPTMILGKSCKLLPVMMVSVLFYGKRYPLAKYLAVVLITLGVSIFTLFDDSSHSSKGSQSNSLFGIFLLLINLFIDGLMNSWQDELFQRWRVKAQHVMFFMNTLSAILLTLYLVLGSLFGFNKELITFLVFIKNYPGAIWDMLAFGLLGSLGQLFIFHTIEHFGSVLLVTVTVTRKLMTMAVSLLWFGHAIRWQQTIGIVAVFSALAMETLGKKKSSH
jgi:UDP-galactose transporter B1